MSDMSPAVIYDGDLVWACLAVRQPWGVAVYNEAINRLRNACALRRNGRFELCGSIFCRSATPDRKRLEHFTYPTFELMFFRVLEYPVLADSCPMRRNKI